MTTLTLASLAVAVPMGQQVYEEEVARRAPDLLGASWDVRRTIVRTLRSALPGTARLPSRILTSASPGARRAAGEVIYRGTDVVHRLDLRLPPAPAREILTVHDIVSWRYPDEAAPPPATLSEARRATVVICPSQFSADEVARVLGVRQPVAIPNGVDEELFSAVALPHHQLGALGIEPPYILHAGGCTLRKNLPALAAAWTIVQQARPETSLVLVGPPDGRRDSLFRPLPGTVLLGRVAPDVMPGIMAAASVTVVPSLYEGFGLPALEAMAVGVPVVAARRAALPEVCADAAILVEPTAAGLADGIVSALDGGPDVADLVARGRVRARRFTWNASAAAHAAVWRATAP
jgi:glycosyltransferase involved in cell wall biosynthesis